MIGLWLLAAGLSIAATSDSEPAKESSPQLSIALADAAYRAGLEARTDAERARQQFAHAARMYDRIWTSGVHNAALARNRAQAHLLAGDLGRAIAAYRSGFRPSPELAAPVWSIAVSGVCVPSRQQASHLLAGHTNRYLAERANVVGTPAHCCAALEALGQRYGTGRYVFLTLCDALGDRTRSHHLLSRAFGLVG